MKKIFKYALMAMFAFATAAVSSCSKDNDGVINNGGNGGNGGNTENTITTPKYADKAMNLIINDANSPYSSIEFTESGTYIIVQNDIASAKEKKAKSIFEKKLSFTRAGYDNIIHGTYTVNGDVYTLENFGTITIKKNEDGTAANLVIMKNGESSPMTINADVKDKVSDSDMTKKLCSTWIIERMEIKETINGKVVKDISATPEELMQKELDEFIKELESMGVPKDLIQEYLKEYGYETNFPVEVTFSMAGTYVVMYSDNTLAVSTWKWKNEEKGIIYYGWEYGKFDEEDQATISYENNKLVVTEEYTEEEDGIILKENTKTILRQKK